MAPSAAPWKNKNVPKEAVVVAHGIIAEDNAVAARHNDMIKSV